MHHVLSARQFEREELEELFDVADDIKETLSIPDGRRELAGRYVGDVLINEFYEPSTRTRHSFAVSAGRLGMIVDSTENAKVQSSAVKGETLEDTIRTLNALDPAMIVLRYHETGGADRAAAVSEVPIINAGDGKGEHPTQAILDAAIIKEKRGRLSDGTYVIGGDLLHGRTAKSLAQTLSLWENNHIIFVAIPELQISSDITMELESRGTSYEQTSDMYDALRRADAVYWTRPQLERYKNAGVSSDEGSPEGIRVDSEMIEMIRNAFVIDEAAMQVLPKASGVYHPLPRGKEISTTVDSDPRAHYFDQVRKGMHVRMALIDRIQSGRR